MAEILGSGSFGVAYHGGDDDRKTVVKLSHAAAGRDPECVVCEIRGFYDAVRGSPFFMDLVSIDIIQDYEFKHPVPQLMQDQPEKYKWYYDTHATSTCIREVFRPLCDGGWTPESLIAAPLAEKYSYLAQMCAAWLHQNAVGWLHCDAHISNTMYVTTSDAHTTHGIPTLGKQWMLIDYADVWKIGSETETTAQRITSENPHMWLARIIYDMLDRPWKGQGRVFPSARQCEDRLSKWRPPACDEPATSQTLTIMRAMVLEPALYFVVMGLPLETAAPSTIPAADLDYLTLHICDVPRVLNWLVRWIM